MKKLALIVCLALTLSVPAFAAESTTTITLQIGPVVTITPDIDAAVLLVSQVGPTELDLGTFAITSNQSGTINYSIASQNTPTGKGFLKGANTGTLFAYEIKFADMASFASIVTDKAGSFSVTANVPSSPKLYFKYGDSTALPADTYTDSIKVTVSSGS